MTAKNPSPYDVASQAAEAIRQLNHVTLNIPEMTAPEISSTVRALIDMVDRLPQTFDQLAKHLKKQLQQDAVRMEDGRDADAPVHQVLTGLRRAAELASPANLVHYGDPAGEFAGALHDAGGWLFKMGAVYTPDDDEDQEEEDGPITVTGRRPLGRGVERP